VNGLAQLFRNLGVARLATLAVVAALSVGFFVFLTSRIATPGYGLLYGDLDAKDSGQIVQKLEASGVPYQLKGDGTSIMVPVDQVARVRMLMADENLPTADRSDTRFSTRATLSALRASSRTSIRCGRSRASSNAPSPRSI
jgi:flagellar M-ring protein FliF